MSLEEKFHTAVKLIRSLPRNGPYQPSTSTKLKFYSLYKQATEGRCNESKPKFWDPVGRAKWSSWNQLGDMNSEEAMIGYINEFKQIVSTVTFDVQDFLDADNSKKIVVVDELTSRPSSSRFNNNNKTSQLA